MALLRVIWAFVIRNFQTAFSYRFAFFLRYLNLIIQVAIFYFVHKVLGDVTVPALEREAHGNYLHFIVTGGIALTILRSSMGSLVGEVRQGQATGTLESIMASPMSITRLMSGSWICNLVFGAGKLLFFLGVCILVLKIDPAKINLFGAGALFLVSSFAFATLGILSAAFALAYKKGDPIALFVGVTSTLFGGVMFPVSVLPVFLQPLSIILPITYTVTAMRKTLLHGASIAEISSELMVLGAVGLILFPISILTFRWGLNKARRDGSLSHY